MLSHWFDKLKTTWKIAGALVLYVLGFVLLYRNVIISMVADWHGNENYSHGFLIPPLACYFAWERRKRFMNLNKNPSKTGIFVVLLGTAILLTGILGSEAFLPRISLLFVLAGSILFIYGWPHLKAMLFPIAFLLLMIPIPAIIFNQVAFPLQLLATRFGEASLMLCQIPVLREGNIILLANTNLEVADACSGIRSLISLLTLGIIYGYFGEPLIWVRVCLVFAAIPIAIVANGIRVAGTGIAAHIYGAEAAHGFFHVFSGWIVFLAAFAMLFLLHRLIRRCFSPRRPDTTHDAAQEGKF
jgi:exosortase